MLKKRQAPQSTDINLILLGETGSVSDLNQPSGCGVESLGLTCLGE